MTVIELKIKEVQLKNVDQWAQTLFTHLQCLTMVPHFYKSYGLCLSEFCQGESVEGLALPQKIKLNDIHTDV